MKGKIPQAVLLLGLASLFADIASESIYPLLPLFITQSLGASVMFLGLVEGVAEAVSSFFKVASGYFSDRARHPKGFVWWGYAISTARSLMGIAWSPWHVFWIRFVDRVGKGIRSAPRDAWLSGHASVESRGRIFGFHRGMDHLGATVAPLLAASFLLFYPGEYRALFLLTFVPGILSVICISLARKSEVKILPIKHSDRLKLSELKLLPNSFWSFLVVLFVLTLSYSADSFLLLKLMEAGVAEYLLPLLWAALNFVKAMSSFYLGPLSDRWGAMICLRWGWLIYVGAYAAFSLINNVYILVALTLAYGAHFGFVEASEKTLVVSLAPEKLRGTAFGLYHSVLGLSVLPANLLFAYLWQGFGSSLAFAVGSVIAFIGLGATLFLKKTESNGTGSSLH